MLVQTVHYPSTTMIDSAYPAVKSNRMTGGCGRGQSPLESDPKAVKVCTGPGVNFEGEGTWRGSITNSNRGGCFIPEHNSVGIHHLFLMLR